MRKTPTYNTPERTICTSCGERCLIVPDLNEFDYAGTHCTHGKSGTHYPSDWGSPVSDCCGAEVNTDPEPLSECCGVYMPDYEECDLCPACKEHTGIL